MNIFETSMSWIFFREAVKDAITIQELMGWILHCLIYVTAKICIFKLSTSENQELFERLLRIHMCSTFINYFSSFTIFDQHKK